MLESSVKAEPIVAKAFRRVKVLSVPVDALVASAVVMVEKSTPPDATEVAVTPVKCDPSPKKAPAVTDEITCTPLALVFVMLDKTVKADPMVVRALRRVNVLSVPLEAFVARAVVTVERSTNPDGIAPLDNFVFSDVVMVEKSTPPDATEAAFTPVNPKPLP